MPFDEFCGRFFLDSQGGTEFAEAYGLQLIRDDQQNTYVTISVRLSLSGGYRDDDDVTGGVPTAKLSTTSSWMWSARVQLSDRRDSDLRFRSATAYNQQNSKTGEFV